MSASQIPICAALFSKNIFKNMKHSKSYQLISYRCLMFFYKKEHNQSTRNNNMKKPLLKTKNAFGGKGFCNWYEFLKYFSQHHEKEGNQIFFN